MLGIRGGLIFGGLHLEGLIFWILRYLLNRSIHCLLSATESSFCLDLSILLYVSRKSVRYGEVSPYVKLVHCRDFPLYGQSLSEKSIYSVLCGSSCLREVLKRSTLHLGDKLVTN